MAIIDVSMEEKVLIPGLLSSVQEDVHWIFHIKRKDVSSKQQKLQKTHFLLCPPIDQSSATLIMTGKQSSPLCLHYSSILTVLIVSCLVAVSSSAPLYKRESESTGGLRLDDIGVYFKMIVEEIDFIPSTLSREVSN